MSVVVASHNLMDGRRLDRLIGDHLAVQRAHGIDVLCVQENRRPDGASCVARIAARLGPRYGHVADHPRTRLGLVYDRARLELTSHQVLELPRLTRLTRFERLFIGSAAPQQKFVQLARFRGKGESGWLFAVANFHLDTAGGNGHRNDQIAAVAKHVSAAGLGDRLVACGDTNAFAFRRATQLAALTAVLEPLASLSARDPGEAPTHFFARQREPKLTHRAAVALGRLGFDVPGRYDVVCTNLEELGRGERSTPDSDHDLVWARMSLE